MRVGMIACAVGWLVIGCCAAVVAFRNPPAVCERRARRWAKEADLALPPELIEPLAARLRQRSLALLAAMALVEVPAAALLLWVVVSASHRSSGGILSIFTGPPEAVCLIAPAALTSAAARAWSVARSQRTGGPRVARLDRVRLGDAVPWWVTWAARVLTVAAVLCAAVVQLLLRQQGYGSKGTVFWFVALLALAVAGLWAVERLQLAILNGRQSAGSRMELAHDESFRVSDALGLSALMPGLAYVSCCIALRTTFAAVPTGPSTAVDLMFGWQLSSMVIFFGNSLLTTRPIRQYYRHGAGRPLMARLRERKSR